MYINAKTSNFLNQHPEFIIGSILFFILYFKFSKSILNILVKCNFIIVLTTISYIVVSILYGFENITTNILTFLIWYMSYTLLLDFIFSDVYIRLGKRLGSWGSFSVDIQNPDAWIVLFSYIPFLGVIPITLRIYQTLGELKLKEEAQIKENEEFENQSPAEKIVWYKEQIKLAKNWIKTGEKDGKKLTDYELNFMESAIVSFNQKIDELKKQT